MARRARVLQLFLGKGEFALLPVGLSARVAASCTASDSNQNSYAQHSLQKRSLVRRFSRLKTYATGWSRPMPVRSSGFSAAAKAAPERSGGAWTKYRLSSVNGSLHNPRRAPRRSYWHGSLASDAIDEAPSMRPSKPTRRLLPNTGRTT
jgi:hypothetical protein